MFQNSPKICPEPPCVHVSNLPAAGAATLAIKLASNRTALATFQLLVFLISADWKEIRAAQVPVHVASGTRPEPAYNNV